jgi:DNA-binding NarL/FixJ family response regulator
VLPRMTVGSVHCEVQPLSMAAIKVLVVDRERAVAQAIAYSLDAEPELDVVGRALSATEAERASAEGRPNVIVLDETIAHGDLAGIVDRLRGPNPGVKLVVTSPGADAEAACASVRAGASGFVTKVAAIDEMVRAVRGVAHGESWIPPLLLTDVLADLRATRAPAIEDARIVRLTDREREVLACMMAGLDRARIARELILSINTIRTHTQNILTKLEVHSSLEAVSLALQVGFRVPARPLA